MSKHDRLAGLAALAPAHFDLGTLQRTQSIVGAFREGTKAPAHLDPEILLRTYSIESIFYREHILEAPVNFGLVLMAPGAQRLTFNR